MNCTCEEIEDEENARNEAHARDPEQADFDCNCGMNSAADCMCLLAPPVRDALRCEHCGENRNPEDDGWCWRCLSGDTSEPLGDGSATATHEEDGARK